MLPLFLIAVALALVARKMAGRAKRVEFDPSWLEDFSISKYRPMLRLLSEDDYEFLASQAGYQGKIASQLRSERRKVFRAYLRNLVRDFHRLHYVAKMMAVHSAKDRPDFAVALLKQRLTFSAAVASLKVRLVLHAVGIGAVDVRNLIDSLDHMRTNVHSLIPQTGQAGVSA